ncbi:PPIases accelerate the folding of proteins. It catalyzes the cis-trans isomerization of proline imidic peptide bonds in oligopeptides (By similarity) [Seminavis robusta]|uniref:peptidylprolyl isomerase n=1 Tax=Seminavis robusta TaxID=568900 RepID=A0A9N8EUV5_9STRA|nr:PPIases accelerate the folding of proteins. It catalyzes the cis-trans isomerization of proline imidic peptide bonds in oligopeptides (By similarity) [Seminavis robusta]|eukprot:Sro2019_g311310.1 PPIases accelerate the folding of proteins. It catalyzes the cis-trans isomerization of proline imidic peptide bonds in oligopeptides (By similarity) (266) ;mRNA; f:6266-7063
MARFSHYHHLFLLFLVLAVTAGPIWGQEGNTDDSVHYVKFEVQLDADTTDSFTVQVNNKWAPLGAARFLELVDLPFFAQVRFFRVLTGFVAQFGISGDPAVSAVWRDKTIADEPVIASNVRGSLTFAKGGPNSRTTQIFVNLEDNVRLDDMGFSPFAQVVSERDMKVVEKLYAGYGEGAPSGNGPDQSRIQFEGNAYLESDFPLLSYILSAKRVEKPADVSSEKETVQQLSSGSAPSGKSWNTGRNIRELTTMFAAGAIPALFFL